MNFITSERRCINVVAIFAAIFVAILPVSPVECLTSLGTVEGITVSADVDSKSYGGWDRASQICRMAGLTIAEKVLTSKAEQQLIFDSVASAPTTGSPYYWTSSRSKDESNCTVLFSQQGFYYRLLYYPCDKVSGRALCEKSK